CTRMLYCSLSFSSLLFLLIRPLPRSTLFPYTTLFRSSRAGLRESDGGPPAIAPEGDDARRLRRRLHEHDLDPPQLGRVLPRERRLAVVRAPGREQPGAGARVARGDRLADGARRRGDVRPLLRRAGLALPAGARRWHRVGADPALVLVADQRLERACRDGRFVRDVPRLVVMAA